MTEYITSKQASQRYNTSQQNINRIRKSEKLNRKKINWVYHYPREKLDKYFDFREFVDEQIENYQQQHSTKTPEVDFVNDVNDVVNDTSWPTALNTLNASMSELFQQNKQLTTDLVNAERWRSKYKAYSIALVLLVLILAGVGIWWWYLFNQ